MVAGTVTDARIAPPRSVNPWRQRPLLLSHGGRQRSATLVLLNGTCRHEWECVLCIFKHFPNVVCCYCMCCCQTRNLKPTVRPNRFHLHVPLLKAPVCFKAKRFGVVVSYLRVFVVVQVCGVLCFDAGRRISQLYYQSS